MAQLFPIQVATREEGFYKLASQEGCVDELGKVDPE